MEKDKRKQASASVGGFGAAMRHTFGEPVPKKKPRKKRKTDEADEQMKFVKWARKSGLSINHPAGQLMGLLIALLGNRGFGVVKKLKAMGMQPGMPDIEIYTRVDGRPEIRGVGIEFKTKTGKEQEDQIRIRKNLEKNGWLCRICKSDEDARQECLLLWPGMDASDS